jgi:hypothetical protein
MYAYIRMCVCVCTQHNSLASLFNPIPQLLQRVVTLVHKILGGVSLEVFGCSWNQVYIVYLEIDRLGNAFFSAVPKVHGRIERYDIWEGNWNWSCRPISTWNRFTKCCASVAQSESGVIMFAVRLCKLLADQVMLKLVLQLVRIMSHDIHVAS